MRGLSFPLPLPLAWPCPSCWLPLPMDCPPPPPPPPDEIWLRMVWLILSLDGLLSCLEVVEDEDEPSAEFHVDATDLATKEGFAPALRTC